MLCSEDGFLFHKKGDRLTEHAAGGGRGALALMVNAMV